MDDLNRVGEVWGEEDTKIPLGKVRTNCRNFQLITYQLVNGLSTQVVTFVAGMVMGDDLFNKSSLS